MTISAFDLFSIGIGPSSSHTVGPMRAAKLFATSLRHGEILDKVARIRVELLGSLGATGLGHGTDRAVILGLEGSEPETVDTATITDRVAAVHTTERLRLLGEHTTRFGTNDLVLRARVRLDAHPNAVRFFAYDQSKTQLCARTYYSIGGGFVIDESVTEADEAAAQGSAVPYPFTTAADLCAHSAATGLPISQLMLANELTWRTEAEVRAGLLSIWTAMQDCVTAGLSGKGQLPGALNVPRRAPDLYQALRHEHPNADPLGAMDWVSLFALAVNEENACGGRVVTAPTNGAAGIIPAVLHYYRKFVPGASEDGVIRFLLTAAAIGVLYKLNASISGAEVGCQGEVGAACSMAAGALCEALGGSPTQVENAAEIAMEHNLGLTCDPIAGLVQIPCIERNAVASVKAITSARIALRGNGKHIVSLDNAIATMRQTGEDMKTKYKETSRGGLAVNVIEC